MISKKLLACVALPLALLFCSSSENFVIASQVKSPDGKTGTLQKLIAVAGSVTMNVDLNRLNGVSSVPARPTALQFSVAANSFFPILVFNDLLRSSETGSLGLIRQAGDFSAAGSSFSHLVIEKLGSDQAFDLAVRDSQTGFLFFNVEGGQYDYSAKAQLLSITGGRLLISKEFANRLGRASDTGAVVGIISIGATMQPIEITHLDENGDIKSATLPALNQPGVGSVPGPDVIIGDLIGLDQSQSGSVGGRVGLALGTDACNKGTVDVNWFSLPSNDHPFIPQNVYRMSGGPDNTERFEQIGQSWGKHAFTAASSNTCGFGCNGVGGSHLGSGCSDAYGSGLNGSQSGIGSRAWVNPFTGNFNGSIANNHSGHTHDVTSHRILVDVNDLSTSLNPGATYFAEAEYIVPHEYTWCQSHPGQCNMYNNASYRRYNVSGAAQPFSFTNVGSTVREQPAIRAWTGATVTQFEPDPGVDGIGMVGYKVTNPTAGVWHYEYAVYNQNLDRAIQSFSIPLSCPSISNLGFHAPLQQPGFANDGTFNSLGYSSSPWSSSQANNAVTWNCETFVQNQNANAIRYGTLYNFRFDSNRPPTNANATIGFFKTGSPMTVQVQVPASDPCSPLQITSVVSRKTHLAAGVFDIDLPLSGNAGVECRRDGGNYGFVFTFTNNVVSGNAAVTSGTGNVAGTPIFSGNTMTLDLVGISDQQQITVTVSNVMDTLGQTLPDTAVNAVMLIGDTNANRSVNSSDLAQTKSQIGVAVNSSNFRSDINISGDINATDVSLLKANTGHSVP